MARQGKQRPVELRDARAYVGKAEDLLRGAESVLHDGIYIAAANLAVSAGIAAADGLTGSVLRCRSAGDDHNAVRSLLHACGDDGKAVEAALTRLLRIKNTVQYEPHDVSSSEAKAAVKQASKCVEIAKRVSLSM